VVKRQKCKPYPLSLSGLILLVQQENGHLFHNKNLAVAEMGDRLATIDIGRKVGGAAVPLSVGEARSPSNTMSPGPRPTSVPSGILIHPTVWPQYTNVTDRQDRQRSRNIGRTVTSNGRPNTCAN